MTLRRLADEQAALRRVATLMASGAGPAELLEAVASEVAAVLDVPTVVLGRFEPDGAVTVVASRGEPARATTVEVPITVDGAAWGLIRVEARAPDAEERVRHFAELLSLGLTNAESRDRLRRLADQQAALRRVATLVAEGAPPDRVSGAVADEVARLAPDTEVPVQDFEALVATAVSNASARERLRRLAEEQAALRRIATQVAEGAAPAEVIAAVADLPAGLGDRAAFDDLIASAAATAEADEALEQLTREQAALRRVATLVARSADPGEIFAAVAASAAELCDLEVIDVVRHEPGSAPAVVASVGADLPRAADAPVFEAPIVVDGIPWGAIVAIATEGHPLRSDTGARFGHFTQLVETAVANLQSHDELRTLVREQAALGRLATLVGEGASADELFSGVASEVVQVLGVASAVLERHEPRGDPTVLARSTDPGRRAGSAASSAPIVVDGRTWGAIRVEGARLPENVDARLQAFTELVATAVSNGAARAELLDSRARIVAAGDEARRRMERDLHDGTQQRLIALGLDLQRIRAGVDPERAAVLQRIEDELGTVLDDLRELSRSLHPPLLSRQGLLPTLRALARRSPIPVELDVELRERPPPAIELALYYVVAEALDNVAAHSRASEVVVRVEADDGAVPFQMGLDGRRGVLNLHVVVADDGVGGAHPLPGSGLAGLIDRVDALGGRLAIDSPPGRGTRLSLVLPARS